MKKSQSSHIEQIYRAIILFDSIQVHKVYHHLVFKNRMSYTMVILS